MKAVIECRNKIDLRPYLKNISWIKGKIPIDIIEKSGKEKVFSIKYQINDHVVKKWDYIPSGKELLEEYYALLEE